MEGKEEIKAVFAPLRKGMSGKPIKGDRLFIPSGVHRLRMMEKVRKNCGEGFAQDGKAQPAVTVDEFSDVTPFDIGTWEKEMQRLSDGVAHMVSFTTDKPFWTEGPQFMTEYPGKFKHGKGQNKHS